VVPRIETDKAEEPDLVGALKAVGPAIGAAVSFEVAARAFLGGRGALGLLIPIISAAGLLTVCIYVAFAKTRTAVSGSSAFPKYPKTIRVLGLTGMVLLTGITLVRIWKARPNFVDGQEYEAGFLCDATNGQPLSEGKVIVLSRAGNPMSQPQELDSRGFFYSELQKRAFLPGELQVYSPTCKLAGQIDIDSSESGACPTSRDAAHNPAVTIREWRVKCQ
jgi:hypothetical protein